MIEMDSKYDNMHTNGIFNALNCINNHVNSYINFMLSFALNFLRRVDPKWMVPPQKSYIKGKNKSVMQ